MSENCIVNLVYSFNSLYKVSLFLKCWRFCVLFQPFLNFHFISIFHFLVFHCLFRIFLGAFRDWLGIILKFFYSCVYLFLPVLLVQ